MKKSLKIALFLMLSVMLMLLACSKEKSKWAYHSQINLPEGSRPLAVVKMDESLWVADPDNYRILNINLSGKLKDSITGIKRPMNIAAYDGWLYVPEYLTDTIWKYKNKMKKPVPVNTKLNAPAGLTIGDGTMAIADFYNHRVVLQTGDQITSIGKEGHAKGELYYPTDVKLFKQKVYVADAYNNRVQIFDKKGTFIRIIGAEDGIKVASVVEVTDDLIITTDQENNRVLLYNHEGHLVQILSEGIDYPTDVMVSEDIMYIANFKGNSLTLYTKE